MWAPNIAEWVFAALGAIGAGGVLVPLNTRFKGAEAAYVLGRSGARFLCTVTGFLDTDYVAMLRDAGVPDTLEHVVVLQGDAPDGTTTFADFLARASEVSSADARARADAIGPDDVCRHHLHLGHHGEAEGRDDHARADVAHVRRVGEHRRARRAATATSWSTRSSTPSGTRPGSSPASSRARRSCPSRCSTSPRSSRTWRPSASRCCRARPRSTCRSSTIPTATRSTSRRCGSRSPARPRCRSR